MILKPNRHHNTKEFDWDPKTVTFSAESSTLRWPIDALENILGRAYDDSIDLGFTLVSDKTGKEVTVAINKVGEDPDYSGGWRYVEFVAAEARYRQAFKVVVFND